MNKIKCITGEVVASYPQYINTQHWRNIKKAYKYSHEYKCQHCGDTSPGLHLHHLTYERIGNERMSDLMYLCELCHAVVHARPKKKSHKPKRGKVIPKQRKPFKPVKKKKRQQEKTPGMMKKLYKIIGG